MDSLRPENPPNLAKRIRGSVKDHSISAANWQKEASILLIPLEPQPYFFEAGGGLWGNIVFREIRDILVEAIEYYPGDRIYFKEKWCEYDGEFLLWQEPTCEVSEHESEWLNWQPVETMPLQAAKEWREIEVVKLFEAEKLTVGMFAKSGLGAFSAIAPKWDKQFPSHPWTPGLWIVALGVSRP